MSPSSFIFLSLQLLLPHNPPPSATFIITNHCPYTVWPAAVPGGGRQLLPEQTWTFTTAAASSGNFRRRIWARTNCSFDDSGNGICLTGDCDGILNCATGGSPPATVVEYSLFQYGDNDFYDISLADGFNVPIEVRPSGEDDCSAVQCIADVAGECPSELKVDGGCKSACNVFKTNEYCCDAVGQPCRPTEYSRFFKNLCPDAYSYPLDDPTSTFICNSGRDYIITFCP